MKLNKVVIKNYRSINQLELVIDQLNDETLTSGLIGVNEAGKTTILRALALKDGIVNEIGQKLPIRKDFHGNTPISIEYFYSLSDEELNHCNEAIKSPEPVEEDLSLDTTDIKIIFTFEVANPQQSIQKIELIGSKLSPENISILEEKIRPELTLMSHKSIFWTAEDRYLISKPIDINQFAINPSEVSIPLKNCFNLAGVTDIKERVDNLLGDSTEVELLETELGDEVTKHIKTVWPTHPIKITFKITDGQINFHVKDLKSKEKAKTADQRSDGFKQFISFLLTISAQDKNSELSNSILLIDEPETHLHPQAQEYLLKDLIEITHNDRSNIVFFATHSLFMIDKSDLSRNVRVSKPNDATVIERLSEKTSTYASVIYDVFGILNTDYHNQLYDRLREKYEKSIDKSSIGLNEFDEGYFKQEKNLEKKYDNKKNDKKVTLPTFVRNAIHYPVNQGKDFEKLLAESIELLKSYDE